MPTTRHSVALLALACVAAGCRPPQVDGDGAMAPLAALRLSCLPTAITDGDTLVVRLSDRLINAEMSIESPDGTFFQVVAEHPTPESGPQLMSSDSLRSTRTLRLAVSSLTALPFVYQARETRRVFAEPGVYRLRIAERLNTDDGTPISTCTVRYRAGPP